MHGLGSPSGQHRGPEESHRHINRDDMPSGCATAGIGDGVGVPAPACTGLHYSTPGTRMRSVLVTSVNTHREEQEGTEQVQ